MSLKNKFLHSIIIGATAIGLSAVFTPPAYAADGSDLALGVLGGLIIAGAIYSHKNRRANREYVTSNNRRYNPSRDNYRYANDYNRYGNDWPGRHQYDHGRHNRFRHSNRY